LIFALIRMPTAGDHRPESCRAPGEADEFAAGIAGKDALVAFLHHLLVSRPAGEAGSWNEVGRRELELRIAARASL
jgi:hypothetical protein